MSLTLTLTGTGGAQGVHREHLQGGGAVDARRSIAASHAAAS